MDCYGQSSQKIEIYIIKFMDQEDLKKIRQALASADITLRVRDDISPTGRAVIQSKIRQFRVILADCVSDIEAAKKKGP